MNLKSFVFAAFLALFAMPVNAQRNDAFFNAIDDYDDNIRGTVGLTVTITQNGIGEPAPLGSGLLVMSLAGAGYVAMRRKRSSRKSIMLLMAFAMLVGMTNCKKNLETIDDVEDGMINITLNVNGGSKYIVNPTGHTDPDFATITFEDGDQILVSHDGRLRGVLTYNNGVFSGAFYNTNIKTNDYLHFYFVGNRWSSSSTSATIGSCSFDIIDQTENYPVISYGRSREKCEKNKTEYTATLICKCAIMKFTTNDIGADKAITIKGMNNKVTLNFGANFGESEVNPFSYSVVDKSYGAIGLHPTSENNVYWAILLPQDAVTDTKASSEGYISETFDVPAIEANCYYKNGPSITLSSTRTYSVSPITQVLFSKGNLQYKNGEGFRFAEHQYDFVYAWNSSSWVNHLGWGTWTGPTPNPLNTSTSPTSYSFNSNDFMGTLDGHDDWRTLTSAEWAYLLQSRPGYDSKMARATVCDVKGLVLLPDNWELPAGCSITTGSATTFTSNTYNTTTWPDMEEAGAIFLPCTGQRDYTTIQWTTYGDYWSSTPKNSSYANCLEFTSSWMSLDSQYGKDDGIAVRLVRDVE